MVKEDIVRKSECQRTNNSKTWKREPQYTESFHYTSSFINKSRLLYLNLVTELMQGSWKNLCHDWTNEVEDKHIIICFIPGLDVKRKVKDYYEIWSDSRPERSDIKLHSGFYYHGESALQHKIGDLRIHFSYAGREDDIVSGFFLAYACVLVIFIIIFISL